MQPRPWNVHKEMRVALLSFLSEWGEEIETQRTKNNFWMWA